MKRSGLFPACLLAVFCASCGGSGSSTNPGGGPVPTPTLSVTADGAFNGDTSPIAATLTDSTFSEFLTTYDRTEATRRLQVWLPTGEIVAGHTIAITGSSVSNIVYTEGAGANIKVWVASGGTTTLSPGTNGTVIANLDVTMSPDSTYIGNTAAGTFRVKGAYPNLPDPFRPGTTRTAAVFTDTLDYSGNSAPMPGSSLIGAGPTQQRGLHLAASVQGSDLRALTLQADLHLAGQTATLGVTNNHDFATYLESTATETRAWRAVSGTLKLVYIKYLGGRIEISGAKFEPDPSVLDNKATGSFTLNAYIEKG